MSKKIKLIFLPIIISYSLYCALQLGYSWDALFHYELGKDRLNYLFSMGSNEISRTLTVSKFYTGAYSTISAFFVQFFPKKYNLEAIYIFNLIFSIFSIFGIYKITKELFNKNIGQITFILCFFNPIFFGHMAVNGSDTIITFANIWLFYVILRYIKLDRENKKRNNYIITAGLLLGLGLGVRLNFLVTLIPIFLFLIMEIFYFKIFINKNFSRNVFFKDTIKVLIISYFFMVLFWPETHQNIFLLPFKLAIESFSFGFGVPFILFNGDIFLTNELPKSYVVTSLFYKMPEFVIFGSIIFICFFSKLSFFFKEKINGFYFKIYLIITIIIFPNILLLFIPWGIYDGIRLFLYIIPFINIIIAIVFYFLFKMIKNNFYKFTFIFLIIAKIFYLFNFFSLTPYHYVYLNLFAGKYADNYKKFENDYWGISTKKLILLINTNLKISSDSKIKIATCGVEGNAQKYYLKKLPKFKFELVDKNEKFDYIIMNNRAFWDEENYNYDPKIAQTCFQKFTGEDIIEVKRRGLVISKITKINFD